MHGLGNDFIVIDDREKSTQVDAELAKRLCDRRLGIGADQILWLKKTKTAHVRMEIWNSDGSTAEMCGNGIRAVGLYLKSEGIADKVLKIDTDAGLLEIEASGSEFRVNMGVPVLGKEFKLGEALDTHQGQYAFHEVSMGNPHAVLFVTDAKKVNLEAEGKLIEHHPRFPKRTNTEFVEIKSPTHVLARVWERGAGATLACGTGACAVGVACIGLNKTKSPVKVELPGGILTIEWSGPGQPVYMTGPATEVFRGEFTL